MGRLDILRARCPRPPASPIVYSQYFSPAQKIPGRLMSASIGGLQSLEHCHLGHFLMRSSLELAGAGPMIVQLHSSARQSNPRMHLMQEPYRTGNVKVYMAAATSRFAAHATRRIRLLSQTHKWRSRRSFSSIHARTPARVSCSGVSSSNVRGALQTTTTNLTEFTARSLAR